MIKKLFNHSKIIFSIVTIILVIIICIITGIIIEHNRIAKLETPALETISEAITLCNTSFAIIETTDYTKEKFEILTNNINDEEKILEKIYKTEALVNLTTKEVNNYQLQVRQEAAALNHEALNFDSTVNKLMNISNKLISLKNEIRNIKEDN